MQDEMNRQASHEAGEREKLILRLENRLLREKLKLPPRTEDKQDNDEA